MIHPFREKNPSRSTPQKIKANYRDYKPELKKDFNSRCGYCDSLEMDTWRETYYEIDHFVPVTIIRNIKKNDYHNLVYSCRSCNNAKRKHWYGNDENIHNNGKEGFIDPCQKEYAELFYRNDDGEIKYKKNNPIAQWIHEKLKLYKKDHALIWKISLIDSILSEIEELDKISKLSEAHKKLQTQLLQLFREYLIMLRKHRG